jgi:hypothetical protein
MPHCNKGGTLASQEMFSELPERDFQAAIIGPDRKGLLDDPRLRKIHLQKPVRVSAALAAGLDMDAVASRRHGPTVIIDAVPVDPVDA